MKKRGRKIRGRNILYHYLITYFIVLFIPLLLCSSYYIRIISVISHDDIREKQRELEHSAALVDTMMDEMFCLADSLAGQTDVNLFRFGKSVLRYPNTHSAIDLRRKLLDVGTINQSVFAYFIFFDKSQVVVNDRSVYDYRDFYDLFLRRVQDASYEEWTDFLAGDKMNRGIQPAQQYLYKGTEELELLSYSRELPYNGDKSSGGVVRIFFERETLRRLMPVLGERDIQYILDEAGEPIFCQTGSLLEEDILSSFEFRGGSEENEEEKSGYDTEYVEIGGEEFVALSHVSDSGFIYHMLLPEKQVNQRKVSAMIMMTACILTAAAVGMLLSWHMSLKSATPLNELMKQTSRIMERKEGHQSVFGHLSDTFQYLKGANAELAERIEEQKPYICNALVNRLLFGNSVLPKEADRIAEYMGIPCENRFYCVLIFRMVTGKELNADEITLMNTCLLSLMEVLEKMMPGSIYANTGEEQVALIMDFDRKEKADFQKLAEEKAADLMMELPGNIAERIFIYGGNAVERLEDVYESYHNASFACQNEKGQSDKQVVWFVKSTGDIPDFPSYELSVKLTRLVTAGDEEGLYDALKEVMTEYIMENNLPSYLQHMILNELQAILFRILTSLELEEEDYRRYYETLEKNQFSPLLVQITNTLTLYREICAHVSRRKKEGSLGELMPAVVAYIKANYEDSGLSLTRVADTFRISEPYLSSLFKQTMGINFSSYVEGVRIDRAKVLLKETGMSVGEIAQTVGYYSANSFCRAFRRVTGLTTSEYRKSS